MNRGGRTMQWLRLVKARLGALVRRNGVIDDIADEMRTHVEMDTAANIARGMEPDEARRAALQSFGSVTRMRELAYDVRGAGGLEAFWHDLRYASRLLWKSPGFAILVILTLSIGIGANTAVFSLLNGVLLRPPPILDIDRVMMVWQTDRASGTTREPSSIPDFFDFRARARRFQQLAAFAGADVSLTPTEGEPLRVAALAATYDFLPLLGAVPTEGRHFRPEDDAPDAPRVVIVSQSLHQRLFGGAAAVDRTIRLNDVEHTIVGVLPPGADFGILQVLSAAEYGRSFADRERRVDVDVWLPLRLPPHPPPALRDNHPIFVAGRLAAGATMASAREEMTRIGADLEREHPATNEARGAFVEPIADVVLGPVETPLYLLIGAVTLLLAIACINVAGLLLVRLSCRVREVAVRTALGAGTRRVVRQLLAEGLVLAAAAAVGGLLLARWSITVLVALAPIDIPRIASVSIDGTALAITLSTSVLIAVAASLMPALHVRRLNIQDALRADVRRTTSADRPSARLQSTLVVVEVALAVMLAIGAGLLIKSLRRVWTVEPGFNAAGVLKAEYQLPPRRYPQGMANWPNWTEVRLFTNEIVRRAAELPGVTAVAIASDHPLAPGFTSSVTVMGRETEGRDWPEPSIRRVSTEYPRTVGLRLSRGRFLDARDHMRAAPVVMVNDTLAQRFFAGRDPLGQRINLWGAQRSIVGVIGDEKIHGLTKAAPPTLYMPIEQTPTTSGALLVRVSGDPLAVAPAVRSIARALDPALPLFGVEPLTTTVAESLSERRFTTLLLGAFAGIALVLAALGVYGILSYGVAQRGRDIGVRLTLGAGRRQIFGTIVGRGLALVAAGVALGLIGALGFSRLLRSLLFEVTPLDAGTFVAVTALILLTGFLAAYLPARRAMRVDPVSVLRD